MSPEQLRGVPVDRRADIFAMGIVMFEMLSLRRLFQRKTDYLTFRAVLDMPLPDISKFRKDVPDAVLGVMKKCLAGEPDKRFATVRQFRQALVAAMPTPPWGDPEVGDFVLSHFAEEIRKRERSVGSVLHRDKRGATMPTIGGSADPEPEIDYFTPIIEIAEDEPTTNVQLHTKAGTTLDDLPKARRRPAKRWVLPLAIAAGLLCIAVAIVVATRSSTPTTSKHQLPPTGDAYVLALRDHQAAFDRCLSDHGSGLSPYARVRVFLEPDGFAYNLAFEPAATADSSLGSCIRNELRTVRFPSAPNRKQILIALTVH
jgi:serine/threonine protein kinase